MSNKSQVVDGNEADGRKLVLESFVKDDGAYLSSEKIQISHWLDKFWRVPLLVRASRAGSGPQGAQELGILVKLLAKRNLK